MLLKLDISINQVETYTSTSSLCTHLRHHYVHIYVITMYTSTSSLCTHLRHHCVHIYVITMYTSTSSLCTHLRPHYVHIYVITIHIYVITIHIYVIYRHISDGDVRYFLYFCCDTNYQYFSKRWSSYLLQFINNLITDIKADNH